MPNITKTIANTAGFIPSVWANRALDILRSNIVLARIVTRDSDFEPGWRGQTLNIPYPGTMVAQDKVADTPVTPQTPTGGASIPVTLNKHKVVDFIVEDVGRAQASGELLDRYIRPAAIALGDAVEDDLFALYSGFSVSTGVSGTDIPAATIRTARKLLNDAKVPTAGRFLIVSSKDEMALLGDAALATYFANSRTQALSEGSIGMLYGFDVRMSQRVPVVVNAPNSTKNLALHPEAMILATRPFQDPPANSGVQATTIVDPETGLAIRVLYSYDVANRGVRIGFDILYGVAELRDAAGIVVLS